MARRKDPELPSYERDPVAFRSNEIHKTERGRPYHLPAHHARALRVAFTWAVHEDCERCRATGERGCIGHLQMRLFLWGEPKKSGKTLLAALLILWWALTR